MTSTRTASFVATLGVAGAPAVAAAGTPCIRAPSSYGVDSSIGLMLMFVALGAMSVTWMLVLLRS